MLSSKSKSSMSDFTSNKSTPSTPRVSKARRPGSPKVDPDSISPQLNPRPSIERSPRSVNSKSAPERRSPKIISPPDKQPRPLKGSEVQAQLTLVQDELKKVKEKLASEEEEKGRVLEELKEAKRVAEEANEKLEDALLSQKMAEQSSELDKFRADELEQCAIEASQKRDEEWMQELRDVRDQHAVDVAALLLARQELQRVSQELVMVTEAKNTALGHADDAMKIAENNVQKIDMFSGEISRLKSLLDFKFDKHSQEIIEITKKFDSESEVLKLELGKMKVVEEQLVDLEGLVEVLKAQLLNAKMDESNSLNLVDTWKKKVEMLEPQLEEASQSENRLNSSLDFAMKQLEERTVMCNDAESEVTSLKGKIQTLELEVTRHEEVLKESNQKLDLSKLEMLDMQNTVEFLNSVIQKVEEERAQSLNNEKNVSFTLETLTQENSKLAIELEIAKEESEKAQKAMEGLASALHEVSMEARDGQERLLIKQSQYDLAAADVEELKSALKNTQEKYELILDEANYEIICLKKSIEKSETDAKDLKNEWYLKEYNLISALKKLEEEIASINLEKDKAMEALQKQKDEAKVADEEASELLEKMKQTEMEIVAAKKSMEKEMAETLNLKERLLDKENELQNIIQENDELGIRDTVASEKIKQLSKLVAELTSRSKENGDARGNEGIRALSDSRREHNNLSLTIEAVEVNVNETSTEGSGAPSEKSNDLNIDTKLMAIENANGNSMGNHNGHVNSEEEEEETVKMEVCEGVETVHNQLSSEWEDNNESVDDESDLKIDVNNLDHVNGANAKNVDPSPINEKQHHRKKKPLLQKFGNMLKKKSNAK